LFYDFFLVYTFGIAHRSGNSISHAPDLKLISTKKTTILVLIGLIGLFFGGRYLVVGAVEFAKTLGMSEKVIGLTIIAIGTSLPELATSVVAAFKKKPYFIICFSSVFLILPFYPLHLLLFAQNSL